MKEKVTISIDAKVLRSVDSFVDQIYIRNRSQAISYLLENKLWRDKTAVILATGPAEQLRIGKDKYRPTARIGDSTVIELAISRLRDQGFRRIYVVGEKTVLTSIFHCIGNGQTFDVHVEFVEDNNPPGNAASLRLLKGELKNTFFVVFGDIIFNNMDIGNLRKHHFSNNGIATVMATQCSETHGGKVVPIKYSILSIEGKMVTKMDPPGSVKKIDVKSHFTYSSLMVCEPSILSYSGNWLDHDVLPLLAEKKLLYGYISSVGGFHVHSREDARMAQVHI